MTQITKQDMERAAQNIVNGCRRKRLDLREWLLAKHEELEAAAPFVGVISKKLASDPDYHMTEEDLAAYTAEVPVYYATLRKFWDEINGDTSLTYNEHTHGITIMRWISQTVREKNSKA